MNHRLILILTSFIFTSIVANIKNELILDYFVYKKTSSIVGFSCDVAEDDLYLTKRLSTLGITVFLGKFNDLWRIDRLMHTDYWKLGVFIDLQCFDKNQSISFFSITSNLRMFDELHCWLVLCPSIKYAIEVINDETFGFSTDFVIAVPSYHEQLIGYKLYDVYNIWKERGGILNVTLLASWSEDYSLEVYLDGSKASRRSNLDGLVMKGAFYYSKSKPANVSMEDYLQRYTLFPTEGLSKFGFVILTSLGDLFNFKLQIFLITKKWETGDVVGPIIESLFNRETDINGSPSTINHPRSKLSYFLHQSYPFRTCFMFRSPQSQGIKMNEILGPFEKQVWISISLLLILSMLALTLTFRHEDFGSTTERCSTSFLIHIGALCQQGTTVKINRLSARFTFACLMMFSLLVYNYYSACVVSVRLNESVFKMNDSLIELSKSNLKIASEWMLYFSLLVKQPDRESEYMYEKRWRRIPEDQWFMEPEEGMKRVRAGGFAYHTHPDVGYPYVNQFFSNRETCEFTEVTLGLPRQLAFAVSHNSTLIEMLRIGFVKLSEVGIRHRQVLRWTAQKPQCLQSVLSASSLTLFEFAPHLLVLIMGMGLAVIICILEIFETRQEIKKYD